MKGLEAIKLAFADLDALNQCLHEQEDAGLGGPLHIITDDGNIEDHHVLGCLRDLELDLSSDIVVRVIGLKMLRILCLLTAPQRLMWFLSRQLRAIGHNPEGWSVYLRDGVVEHQQGLEDDWKTVVTRVGNVVFPGLRELKRVYDERLRNAPRPEEVPDATTSEGD